MAKPRYTRLWVETTPKGYRVNGRRADGTVRLGLARANTPLGIGAELSGLARRNALTVVEKHYLWGAVPYTRLVMEAFTTTLGTPGWRVLGDSPFKSQEVLQMFRTAGGAEYYLREMAVTLGMSITQNPGGHPTATTEG